MIFKLGDRRVKIRNILLFILIISIGIFLRIYNLGRWGFWFDEIDSILYAKFLNWHNLTELIIYEPHPPLFPFLLHFWGYLSNSEFILRLLPLIFGILSIFVIYKVGKLLFNAKTGLISALLLSISPFHIYYSQELRQYTLLTFITLISIFYLIKSLEYNKFSSWICFIFFTILSLYTHNISIFLLIAENIFFIICYKRYETFLRRWLTIQLFIILFYLPYFKIILEQITIFSISNLFTCPAPNYLFNFIQTFMIFNSGYNSPKITQFLAVFLFTLLFFLGVLGENKKEETWLLLCWLFIPLIMTFILTIFITRVYLFRMIIYTSVPYYILIAYSLSKLKPHNAYLYILLVYIIITAFGLKNYYQNFFPFPEFPYRIGVHPRKDTKHAAIYIRDNFQKKDVIGHSNLVTYPPFFYYHKDRLEEKLFTLGYLTDFYFVHQKCLKFIKMMPADVREITSDKYNRIWLVLSNWEPEIDQMSKDIKGYLDKNYIMTEYKRFTGITVCLYKLK